MADGSKDVPVPAHRRQAASPVPSGTGDGLSLYHVCQPMNVTFSHAAKARQTSDSVVLAIRLADITGLGEAAPRTYVTGETGDGVAAACLAINPATLLDPLMRQDPLELLDRLMTDGFAATFALSGGNTLIGLLEMAVLDWLCRRLGWTVGDALRRQTGLRPGSSAPETLPVSQVLDLATPVETFLARNAPFHFIKIKASQESNRDIATVRAIRHALGDAVPVMVDANMSWSAEEAYKRIAGLSDAGVNLFEEPVAKGDLATLADVRRRTGARLMLDESLCSPADALAAVQANAVDAFNIRVSKCGGLRASLRLIDIARQSDCAYQLGVQVAEVGPLIVANRLLAFHAQDQITLEAGQSDRFFDRLIVTPAPGIDRTTNRVAYPGGHGFGLDLNDDARLYAIAETHPRDRIWRGPARPERVA